MDNARLVKTASRPLIDNLDVLPFPKHEIVMEGNRTYLLTSRGCPFHCSFCSGAAMAEHRIRYRSMDSVIQELEYIRETYPQIKYIHIVDDTFLIDNDRAIDFCNKVIDKNLRFHFLGFGRVKPISQKLVNKLEQAGFTYICFGVESGNDEIRRRAYKNISKEEITNTVRLFAQTKIDIHLSLIVGLPGETWATIKETGLFIQKMQKIKYMHIAPTIAMVYPNTELYRLMATTDDYDLLTSGRDVPLYTREHNEETLIKMHRELCFYVYPDCFFMWRGFYRQWHVLLFSADRGKILKYLLSKSMRIYFKKAFSKYLLRKK